MFLYLFLLFTVVPAVELYLLIQVGQEIGALQTIYIIVLTGVVGAALARSQGRKIFFEVQKQAQAGEVPADAALQGLMIFIGGLLLITPGFITDVVGFSLVIPLTRKFLLSSLQGYFRERIRRGNFHVHFRHNGGGFQSGGFQGPFGPQEPPRDVTNTRVIDVTPKKED